MSKPRVFIDGHAGTTGLRIHRWLADRKDLAVSTLDESERKSDAARQKAIAESDLTILCLPDDEAAKAAGWAGDAGAKVLDASSFHRVADGWVYGMPELGSAQRSAIESAQRVTNPGCYPSAFVLMIRPLVDAGLVPASTPLAIHALSGYSGGGKGLISRWESEEAGLKGLPYEAPYALERIHKHIPEMHRYSGLDHAPQFVPAVGPYYCGMRVEVPLHSAILPPGADVDTITRAWNDRYLDEVFVEVAPSTGFDPVAETTLDPTALNETNQLRLHVYPNRDGHLLLVGILDNLGKGASGVAIQNLNLMLGLGEASGLPRAR
jgi:N-acetyl-gamma-glutamyl-phosphate reductase